MFLGASAWQDETKSKSVQHRRFYAVGKWHWASWPTTFLGPNGQIPQTTSWKNKRPQILYYCHSNSNIETPYYIIYQQHLQNVRQLKANHICTQYLVLQLLFLHASPSSQKAIPTIGDCHCPNEKQFSTLPAFFPKLWDSRNQTLNITPSARTVPSALLAAHGRTGPQYELKHVKQQTCASWFRVNFWKRHNSLMVPLITNKFCCKVRLPSLTFHRVANVGHRPSKQGTCWSSCQWAWVRSEQQPVPLLLLGLCTGACLRWIPPELPQMNAKRRSGRRQLLCLWIVKGQQKAKFIAVLQEHALGTSQSMICTWEPFYTWQQTIIDSPIMTIVSASGREREFLIATLTRNQCPLSTTPILWWCICHKRSKNIADSKDFQGMLFGWFLSVVSNQYIIKAPKTMQKHSFETLVCTSASGKSIPIV